MLRNSLAAYIVAAWLALGCVAVGQGAPPAPIRTPPIAPNTQDTPVPPRVDLPRQPAPDPADLPNRPLTADEAAHISLRHQPNIAVARAGIAAQQGVTQQIRSALQPALGLSTGYTSVQTLSVESNSTTAHAAAITASAPTILTAGFLSEAIVRQLVFDFNHTRDLVRQSQAEERAAKANLTRVQSDTVFQVKEAFYTYSQDMRLVGVNEANVANRQSQLDLAKARLGTGLGLPVDVATAATAFAEAVTNLTLARANASFSRINLALLMGIDPRTPLLPADVSEPPLTTDDVTQMVTNALRQRPDILEAEANVKSAQFGVRAAKTTDAPSLSASMGFLNGGKDITPGTSNFSIGASLVWTPFDGGLTAGRVKTARADEDTARAQLNGTQISVVNDVGQAYVNVRTAEQRVASATSETRNAEEEVRIATGRYAKGLGIFLDIINAQAALLTARTNQVTAQANVDQARAALAHAIGAPLP